MIGATPAHAAGAVVQPPPVAEAEPAGRLVRLLLLVLGPLLALATIVVVFVPGFYVAVIAPDLDAIINTATTFAAGSIAALAWIRFRETGQPDALYQASAFLLLCAGGVLTLLLVVTHTDTTFGFAASAPGQAPLYLWTIQRFMAGILLLGGAVAVVRRWPRPEPRLEFGIVLGPVAGLLLVTLIVLAAPTLPELVPPATLALLGKPLAMVDVSRLSTPIVLLQLIVAGLFLAGAYAYARLHAIDQRPYSAFLELGLIVAAFSQLHSAVVPGAYTGLVATADVLRLIFYGILLGGVANAARLDLIALREANENLVRLQAGEADRVATAERARVAREIHDGLVQELWLARLTQARLGRVKHLPAEARAVVDQVDGILEDALAEARHAVASLQPTSATSLGDELRRLADDYADHFGLNVEVTIDNDPGTLDGNVQAEIMRICREALTNVRKHADASLVRLRLRSDGSTLRLMVADNGKGFDPTGETEGFGMRGMEQRAESVGGRLYVESEPLNGTRVVFEMALTGATQ